MGWIENDWVGDYLLIFDWNFGGFTGGPSSNFSIKVVQFLGDEPWCFRGLKELGLLQVWSDLWESSHDCGWVMWMIEWSEPPFQSLPNHWCFRFLQIHRESWNKFRWNMNKMICPGTTKDVVSVSSLRSTLRGGSWTSFGSIPHHFQSIYLWRSPIWVQYFQVCPSLPALIPCSKSVFARKMMVKNRTKDELEVFWNLLSSIFGCPTFNQWFSKNGKFRKKNPTW